MVSPLGTMEHGDLIREMQATERLTTQERLKLARKRRKDQLRYFFAREKEASALHKAMGSATLRSGVARRIHFVDAVVLLESASRNDVSEVRQLLELGVNPDSTNEDGLTALHQCCIDDSEAMMTVLLDHGANVDAQDSERWTPLHAAATCGHLHLVRQLVERGANLLAVNADGNMPYDICDHNEALQYIETQMARRLITQELIEETRSQLEAAMLADLQQRSADGLEQRADQDATPLHVAAANGYISVLEYLLERRVSVDPRDKDDWQPVHAAACWGHPRVIELLCQHGADLNAKTKSGETPFAVCEDPEIRERLEQLRTEQEMRRTSDARARVRRTQSTKHSIRRTSMRQKTLTPKKDVKEEARIRLGVEGWLPTQEDQDQCLDPDMPGLQDITIQIPDRLTISSNMGSVSPRLPGDNRTKANGHQVNNNDQLPPGPKQLSLESSSSLDSGKIDIHVHVTVNTGGSCDRPPAYSPVPHGSLAEVKRQRALARPALTAAPPPLLPPGGSPAPSRATAAEAHHRFVSAAPGDAVTSEPPRERVRCCRLQ